MGNDGGSIPDRRDLVRSKPKVITTPHILVPPLTILSGRASGQGKPGSSEMVLLCALQGTSLRSGNVAVVLTPSLASVARTCSCLCSREAL